MSDLALEKNSNNIKTVDGKKIKVKKKKKKRRGIFNLKMPKSYDMVIHACTIILMLLGSLVVLSTSVGETSSDHGVVIKTLGKQLVFVCLSYFAMTKVAYNFIRFRQLKGKAKFMKTLVMVGIFIIFLLMSCFAFSGANGTKGWIYLGPISIQPSEFAKSFLIVYAGIIVNEYYTLRQKNKKEVTFKQIIFPIGIFSAAMLFLIALQPDFGTCVVLMLILLTIFLIPTNPCLRKTQKYVKVFLISGLLIGGFLFFTDAGMSIMRIFLGDGYKAERFMSAANPFNNHYGTGYNIVYSLYAIANGGFKGLGIGGSKEKFGYLPEAQTDFILSVTIEELGIVGFGIIIICYGMILYRLFYWATHARGNEGYRVILIGTAMYLIVHFIFNVGGVSGLIPLTGVPLLFISAGGSSLFSISILMGVCQSIISKIRIQNESYRKKIRKERGLE